MFAILMILGAVLMPHIASADWMSDLSCIFSPARCVEKTGLNLLSNLAASLGNLVLTVSSWFLSLAGIILNISIILTMNIKAIYESTPAIGEVWIVIRNISSMFIIFGLIFTSIQTILDMGRPNVKGLIINIIIAGLLINFSLFFTKALIDASNLVSLQFYRAISPDSQNVNLAKGDLSNIVSSSWSGVGLSNIFMQSLKIPSVYSTPKGFLSGVADTDFTRIFISTIAGSALMIFAAFSFFAASIAFMVRVVILLLLMGFSPVYFLGLIFPQVKTNISKKWEGWFIGQLIFMPAYLLLMYVAMKFIAGPGFFAALDVARTSSATGPAGILLSTVGLLLQFTIAFILINVPLVAALKLGGLSTEWGNNAKKWASDKLKSGLSFAGQHSAGRGAKALQEKLGKSDFAARNPNIAIMANKTLGNVAANTFGGSKGGYEKRYKDFTKERTDFGNKGIKLNDKEKDAYINNGLSTWNDKNASILKNKLVAETLSKNMTISEQARQTAKKKLAELIVEEKAREKADNNGTKEKHLQDEALKNKKEEYAKNLEKGQDFFTTKARKDAAKAVRDEMSKPEEKKLLETMQKLTKEAEKEPDAGAKDKK